MDPISRLLSLLSLGLLICLCPSFTEGARRLRGLREPPVTLGSQPPQELWFVQKLDHSKPTDLRTWKQRYFVNDEYFTKTGPVFLMIGGEGEASGKWMQAGAWIEFAKLLGALCFQLEHRFYGKSRPTDDTSVESLALLTSEQALSDLAHFIVSMKAAYGLGPENKWVSFGGSYPGSLSAWLRYKFPHLVHAAVSSSAPLLALPDFYQYNEVVRASLATSSEDCVTNVRLANKHLTRLFGDQASGDLLTEKFRLCTKLDLSNSLDKSMLAESLSANFDGVVQYNKDNRITTDPTANVTIDDVCDIMTNSSLGDPIDRYAEVNNLMLKLTNQSCLNYTYDWTVEQLRNTTWSESPEEAGRQWTYQTCVEFGYYQTSSTDNELFGPNFPLDLFIRTCKDVYGERFDYKLLEEGVNRTNTNYGDLHLKVRRVLFVHGSIDPWHALGIISSKNPDAPALFIKGTAHCADMYPSSPSDFPQLKQARKIILTYLRKWLNEEDNRM